MLNVGAITTHKHDRPKPIGKRSKREEIKIIERNEKARKRKNEKGKERIDKTRKAREYKTRKGSKERKREKQGHTSRP